VLRANEDPGISGPYAIAEIAEKVTPAVVYVEAEWPARPRSRSRATDPFSDFFFFFPFNPWPETPPQIQRGTGFIISEDGYILTNQHVVGNPGDGQTIRVKLSTPTYQGELEAELVGADYQLDLAVLKIEKPRELERLPTIPLGDSDASRPGEWVIAIGNPYGERFEHTVTVGVLSAKGREIEIFDRQNGTSKRYTNLMQTDAAINPGNSGGPLINIRGEVIGINTAVNAAAQGIGFAIPINTALKVKDELINEGRVRRAYLGIGLEDLTREIAQAIGLDSTEGVLIRSIEPGSAAFRAGLNVYDVIRRIDDKEIKSARDLTAVLETYRPGDRILVEVWRRGDILRIPVTLGERPPGI